MGRGIRNDRQLVTVYNYVSGMCLINPLIVDDSQSLEVHRINMVNKVIKPNTCKELTKKNGVSIRNSTGSAKSKKSNNNLKVNVSNNSEVAVDV